MKKKPVKVLKMKLVPENELNSILCDLLVLEDLLASIANPEEPANTASAIHHFMMETTRKLDKLTTRACDVRWTV